MARADRRRRIRRLRRKLASAAMPAVAPWVLGRLSATWRVEHLGFENYERVLASPGRLATLWHGRMVLAIRAYRGTGVTVLVSPSADGQLMVPLLGRFGYGVIRGSTSKPARSIREMVRLLEGGGWIVITPDGPRGPRHSMNPGPAWISRATGYPLLPLGFVAAPAWHLRSWDRFTIPKPRARVVLVYGEPLQVEADASDEDVDEATAELKRRMIAAEEQGFRHLGREPDW